MIEVTQHEDIDHRRESRESESMGGLGKRGEGCCYISMPAFVTARDT